MVVEGDSVEFLSRLPDFPDSQESFQGSVLYKKSKLAGFRCRSYNGAMTSLPLLLSLFFHSQPMDTGLVVKACLGYGPGPHISLRIWNASPRTVSDLRLRMVVNGAAASLSDLGWRGMNTSKIGVNGLPSETFKESDHATPPVLIDPGCAGDSCAQVAEVPLGTFELAPLEGFKIQLHPYKIEGGQLSWNAASHSPNRGDWSFSNLDSGTTCTGDIESSGLRRAIRLALFSGTTKLWGNGPGESYERPDWPLADFAKASFAPLMRVPSDTVPVAVRDARNRAPGRWLVNQAGYRLSDVKAGRAQVKGVGVDAWTVIDAQGNPRGSGVAKPSGGSISARLRTIQTVNSVTTLLDSTGPARAGALTEFVLPSDLSPTGGPYRVVSGTDTSAPFSVDDDLYGKLRDASLRFFGVQRSGNSSSWYRPASFAADPVPGGWYDCGDRIKEGITMGYAMEVLGTLAATHPERDPDRTSWLQSLEKPDGVPDLVRELRHGADFALASWDLSGKDPANMASAVGDMHADQLAWMHDMWVDFLPAEKGGPASRTGRKEMGGNVAGSWAAGLAFAARLQKTSDPEFAQRALEAAKGIYAWGKANPTGKGSAAYSDVESTSKLAFAAVALLWATGDTAYLRDLTRNDSIAKNKAPMFWYSTGGWFGKNATGIALGATAWPLDYADPQPLVLYAFLRLILPHPDTASRYGIDAARYDSLRDLAMYGVIRNLGSMADGDRSVALPGDSLRLDANWAFPLFGVTWGASRYQSGIFAAMLLYADLARAFQERPSVHYPAGTAFLADSVESWGVRGMDYLLGQNPWDMSFLMGIGSRNLNHIHHRTANPEGRNLPSVDWVYRTPVGALLGGALPDDTLLSDGWKDYTQSETCLDFAATFLVPATLLAAPMDSSTASVRPSLRAATAPRWSWNPRTGILGWSGAPAGLRWEILDARGRVVGQGSISGSEGRRALEVPAGVSVLRWRTHDANGILPLLRLSR